jgi:hypothetical protein
MIIILIALIFISSTVYDKTKCVTIQHQIVISATTTETTAEYMAA